MVSHFQDDAHSRLFLSADLVGSTARKQSQGTRVWVGDVLAFYQQFPEQLDDAIDAAEAEQANPSSIERPTLWKAVGDELIYTAVVRDERQVLTLVRAWIAAMRSTEEDVLDKSASGLDGMQLKGGAWIGTFPLPDRAVAVPLNSQSYDPDMEPHVVNRELLAGDPAAHRLDFLGPSIDIGFRILSYASVRRFILSVEVAWALAAALDHANNTNWPIYFAGQHELKGVWAGRPYPIFWCPTANVAVGQVELETLGGVTPANRADVRALAQQLHERDKWPSLLYLPASSFDEMKLSEPAIMEEVAHLRGMDDTSGDPIDFGDEPE